MSASDVLPAIVTMDAAKQSVVPSVLVTRANVLPAVVHAVADQTVTPAMIDTE